MKTKPKRKPPGGYVCAMKIKSTPGNAWMPQRCAVHLTGTAIGTFLEIDGFTVESTFREAVTKNPRRELWPIKRLEKTLPKLKEQWRNEYGAGWTLEIRAL